MRTLRISIMIVAVVFLAAGCHNPAGSIEPTSTGSGPASTGADNGIADLPVEQIAEAAVRGLTHNYPMRLKGKVLGANGEQVLTFDIVRKFSDGRGTVLVEGHTLELVRLGGHDYAKTDAKSWIARGPSALKNPSAAARADGKWVRGNLYSAQLPVGKFLDLHENVWEGLVNDTAFGKGQRRVVNGVPTIAFTSGNVGTVYVATQGEPNVIRVESPAGTTIVDYSEYGNAVVIEEPPADQIIDLESLSSTGS